MELNLSAKARIAARNAYLERLIAERNPGYGAEEAMWDIQEGFDWKLAEIMLEQALPIQFKERYATHPDPEGDSRQVDRTRMARHQGQSPS